MRAFFFTLRLLPLVFMCVSAYAKEPITWESQRIETDLPIGETIIAKNFYFINNTAAPISIREISTTCGCTAASYTAGSIAAGQKGSVRMEFNAGQRRGLQRNTATVHFAPATIPPQRIEFVVAIPEIISARPTLVHWTAATMSQSRSVVITLNAEFDARLVNVSFPPQYFSLKLTHGPEHLARGANFPGINTENVNTTNATLQLHILPNLESLPSAESFTITLHALTAQGTRHEQRIHLRMR
jgi:hypothetical protein